LALFLNKKRAPTMVNFYSLFIGFCVLTSGPAVAQSNYPERSIRLIFGFPAGSDVGLRVIAEKLGDALGRSVVIENVTGAAGNIAAERTAAAAPDGHTLGVLTGANIVLRRLLYRQVPHESVNDLIPVSLAFSFGNILTVNNDLPAKTVAELVKLARAAPGKLTFGHRGLGSVTHLSGELLKVRAAIDIQGVPYRGPPPILVDLIAGRLAMTFNTPGTTLPMITAGKVRAMAVTSRTRMPMAPQIPTMIESGFPDFETTVWFGLFVPAKTPQTIIDRIVQETGRVMRLPDVRNHLYELGWIPVGSTQAEFRDVIRTESQYWAQLIKDAGIKPLD
jgi:tripartite-type tricarboxylate transporter receptor subunit TctC